MPQIPFETIKRQRIASDPKNSVWVSANAGSGKTHILAQRVLRLLLCGTPPAKILCLTFTKAAAANMAARVFDKLAEWTRLDDTNLRSEIDATGANVVSQQELTQARRLFARAVETPGGLKIQTIHAFCEKLLHLFPFEANVPARFEVLEEHLQFELLQHARQEILTKAQTEISELTCYLQRLSDECNQDQFNNLIDKALSKRAWLKTNAPNNLGLNVRKALGLAADFDRSSLDRAKIEGMIDPRRWGHIANFLSQGLTTDIKRADKLRLSAKLWDEKADWFPHYVSVFLTKENEPYKTLITKELASKSKDVSETIQSDLKKEQERLENYISIEKSLASLERSLALLNLSDAIFNRYENLKLAKGVLDFDDLISKTLELVIRADSRWVLYKLDSGIDHILVDEAQDTSEAQWKILETLTEEFPQSDLRVAVRRTFFAVGDEKQSIFSFQGAAPHMFDEMRRRFDSKFNIAPSQFEHVRLTHSFRSVPCVLKAVDKVFETSANQKGVVTKDDRYMPHEAIKGRLPGLVEIWPLVSNAKGDESRRDWKLPLEALDSQEPASIIASRITLKIKELITNNQSDVVFDGVAKEYRCIRPGDILVLVRSRGPLFSAVIRALKQLEVPVAGADRLDVFQHIAIMDLVALGHAVLLPQDDLTLACVLKSPLMGLNDDDLIALAPLRKTSLFDALAASSEPRHIKVLKKFLRWQQRAAMTPFSFYAHVLGEDGGRRDLVGRLGPEAADAIDEFLTLTLNHQRRATSSLGVFITELEGLEISLRRDMENGADLVRVMTVHAAKGLEAKIVFLPDTCSSPSRNRSPEIFDLLYDSDEPPIIAWSPKKDADCIKIAEARIRARELEADEHRRLLYVALTRAEERLYIAGFKGSGSPPEGCWFKMIATALPESEMHRFPAFWDESEFVLRTSLAGHGDSEMTSLCPDPLTNPSILSKPKSAPSWLFTKALIEFDAEKPIHPSNALSASLRQKDDYLPNSEKKKALQSGVLAHALLQFLPPLKSEERESAAKEFLHQHAAGLETSETKAIISKILAVLNHSGIGPIFSPGSKTEVPIAGKVSTRSGNDIKVSGKIDRIGENGGTIFAVDYKWGSPSDVDTTPQSYLVQMGLYRGILKKIWPDKKLKMVLIWLSGPLIVELADEEMDLALLVLDESQANLDAEADCS